MKILFAAPDRDLLSAYSRLLSDVETETDTAFDGTQAAVKLETEKWDLLILSRDIPRLGWTKILELCRELSVPVILLSGRQTGAGEPGTPAADAYLTMPFTPDELKTLADRVGKKAAGEPDLAARQKMSSRPAKQQIARQETVRQPASQRPAHTQTRRL